MKPPARALTAALALATFISGGGTGCAHADSSGGAAARQAVVEAKLPELQGCWSELPSELRTGSGSLLFAVDLRRSGAVDWVRVEVDELGIPALTACTVRRIKRWSFPEDQRRSIRFGVGFQG